MDGPKPFPGKQTADPGLLSPFRMDGWVIKIIGFKLLMKGRDIRSASNVLQNTIPAGGSYLAKALLAKLLAKGRKSWKGF